MCSICPWTKMKYVSRAYEAGWNKHLNKIILLLKNVSSIYKEGIKYFLSIFFLSLAYQSVCFTGVMCCHILKLKKKLIVFCSLLYVKMSSNFNCSYISKSSLTYVPILSEIFLSTNFYLLANKAYFDKLWLIALFSIERWHRILKIDIYLIAYCYFIISQNELNS
jgi:hypothetical protein